MHLARRDFMHGVLALPGVASFGLGLRPSFGTSVRSGDELKAALATATPGTTIVLAPGDFGGVDRFELTVPHVTLRASVPLRSTMRAPLEVHADHARIVDLAFRGEVDDNLHLVALAACTDYLYVTANDTEITGCDFGFFPQRAIFIRSGTGAYIHDCTFHDNTNGKTANSHEAIGLGYSNLYSLQSMKARVVNNKLWNLKHDGETISVKTSDNIVEGNEMISCTRRLYPALRPEQQLRTQHQHELARHRRRRPRCQDHRQYGDRPRPDRRSGRRCSGARADQRGPPAVLRHCGRRQQGTAGRRQSVFTVSRGQYARDGPQRQRAAGAAQQDDDVAISRPAACLNFADRAGWRVRTAAPAAAR